MPRVLPHGMADTSITPQSNAIQPQPNLEQWLFAFNGLSISGNAVPWDKHFPYADALWLSSLFGCQSFHLQTHTFDRYKNNNDQPTPTLAGV